MGHELIQCTDDVSSLNQHTESGAYVLLTVGKDFNILCLSHQLVSAQIACPTDEEVCTSIVDLNQLATGVIRKTPRSEKGFSRASGLPIKAQETNPRTVFVTISRRVEIRDGAARNAKRLSSLQISHMLLVRES